MILSDFIRPTGPTFLSIQLIHKLINLLDWAGNSYEFYMMKNFKSTTDFLFSHNHSGRLRGKLSFLVYVLARVTTNPEPEVTKSVLLVMTTNKIIPVHRIDNVNTYS